MSLMHEMVKLLRDFGIYVYTLRDWTIPVTTHNFFFNTNSSWCLLTPRDEIHYLPPYRHKNEHHVTANDGGCSSVPTHLPHSHLFVAYSRRTCEFLHVKPWRWLSSVTWHVGSLEKNCQLFDKCFLFIP